MFTIDLHLGCEQTCVNNYIKSCKPPEKYRTLKEGQWLDNGERRAD